jgi:hypothetical protein
MLFGKPIVKINRRINNAAELLSTLHKNAVRLEGIYAEGEMQSVPLDTAKRHIGYREGPAGLFDLLGAHELHLDFGG